MTPSPPGGSFARRRPGDGSAALKEEVDKT